MFNTKDFNRMMQLGSGLNKKEHGEAFTAGYIARSKGQASINCPYDATFNPDDDGLEALKHIQWMRGWYFKDGNRG